LALSSGAVASSGFPSDTDKPLLPGQARYDPERLERQRVDILEATERLVAVHGFSKVRLRDISHDTGLSIGALQHHFDTRDKLLREAFLWSAERRIEGWRRRLVPGDDPWQKLQSLLVGAFEVDDFRSYSAIWAEYSTAAFRDEEVREVMAHLYEQWREPILAVVRAGVEAGVFVPACGAATAVNVLLAEIDGLEIASIISPAEMGLADLPGLAIACARAILGVRAAE
jgi:AcrR family transcriptional regulator